jgi:hypothetical protein
MAESILSCGACLRRAMHLLPQHRVAIERAALLQTLTIQPARTQPRFLSTPSSIPSPTAVKSGIAGEQQPSTLNQSTPLSAAEAKAAITADPDAVGPKKARQQLERNVKKHLSWLDDPWQIAKHVADLLKKERYDEALLMTQKSSAKHKVEVSWNHLIGYALQKQQLRVAIKLYNDVRNSPCMQIDLLTHHLDEEARPIAKLADLRHHVQRIRQVATPEARCGRGPQALPDSPQ